MTTTNDNVAETSVDNTPKIVLTDLENAVRIIDYASKKGAFEGSDLSFVGSCRDSLALFVNYTKEQLAKSEEATTEGAATNG